MKELTKEQLYDRVMAVQRAKAIFIESGLTNNITKAFEAYQEIFAEREREIFLSSQVHGNREKTVLDKYERIRCPDCDSDMMFRQVPTNPEGIKVQLVCSNGECDTVLNSENDLLWWMQNMRVKDGPVAT